MKCEHMHKDDPENAVCEDCYCGNRIKQYEEGDDTMEVCEECK